MTVVPATGVPDLRRSDESGQFWFKLKKKRMIVPLSAAVSTQLCWNISCAWKTSQRRDSGRHLVALQCICSNIVSLSSLGPRLSGIFTGSALVIVFSFSGCPPVTTLLSHSVWAKPRWDTDFTTSVGVTVPWSPVPPQKQTWFSFPTT